jgi:hypothetical protein
VEQKIWSAIMSKAEQAISTADLMTQDIEGSSFGDFMRSLVIGLTAFLTVVDLFATQAILPLLSKAYGVTPAAMGLAVNATTIGMAFASFMMAFFSQRIDRRRGILISLTLLTIPTLLLAHAPNLAAFATLRNSRALHGLGLHLDARLSRRALQRPRHRWRLRRIYCR